MRLLDLALNLLAFGQATRGGVGAGRGDGMNTKQATHYGLYPDQVELLRRVIEYACKHMPATHVEIAEMKDLLRYLPAGPRP